MTLLPAMPQDVHYHDFADQRALFGIPNFFNVISSLPYLLVGMLGYLLVLKQSQLAIIFSLKWAYAFFSRV